MYLNPKKTIINIIGGAILAFGLCNIHAFSNVTEGGTLGLTLFLNHWFNISPSLSSVILNLICYIIGFKHLGREFVFYSIVSVLSFSLSYSFFDLFDPIWPALKVVPFVASVLGAIFVGVGVGLCIRSGGAPSGDDALAMSLSTVFKCDIRIPYLLSDIIVLILCSTYIDFKRLLYSLLSVIMSGQIIGIIQKDKH